MAVERICFQQRHGGFSMIEVLITLFLFSIGLLGMGALYARGLSISHSSYLRSVASIQAADIGERMRANPWAADDAYLLDVTDCSGAAAGGVQTPSATQACDAASCTAAQLAQWDLKSWCEANQTLFGGVFATADIDSAGDDYRISLSWQERALQENNQQSMEIRTFEYRFRP